MKKTKLYPFSTEKHAHDIEYRRNRTFNEMREYEENADRELGEEYKALCELHKKLTELLEAVLYNGNGRVCYLTGSQIGLAKECVEWARNKRANTLIESGRLNDLQYL